MSSCKAIQYTSRFANNDATADCVRRCGAGQGRHAARARHADATVSCNAVRDDDRSPDYVIVEREKNYVYSRYCCCSSIARAVRYIYMYCYLLYSASDY